MSAAGALIDMAAEGGGATACDGQQDLKVVQRSRERFSMKSAPALRMMSATSQSGRLIYSSSGDLPLL
jgi:hypothetical protein